MRVLFLLSLPLLLVGQASAGCTLSTLAGTYGGVAALPAQVPVGYGTGYSAAPALDVSALCAQACAAQAPAYQSYTTAAAFAVPTYLSAPVLAPAYRTYVPTQATFIQRTLVTAPAYASATFLPRQASPAHGYGGGTAFLGPPVRAGFQGGFSPGIPVQGGGGGLANLIRTAGDVVIQAANSPAGSFFLGAQAARGKFPFKK